MKKATPNSGQILNFAIKSAIIATVVAIGVGITHHIVSSNNNEHSPDNNVSEVENIAKTTEIITQTGIKK